MPQESPHRHLLILGGTQEAAALAAAALERFGRGLDVTTSLAGRTPNPARIAGETRSGGFGGAHGLMAYLGAQSVDLVIDATHPFAAQISAHAAAACAALRVPRLLMERPPWPRHPGDRWIEVADAVAAAEILPSLGHRAFLTIGARGLDAFAPLTQMHFLVRLIAAPRAKLPLASFELLLGRSPFGLAEERLIVERHAIDMLVAKASGGSATAAKLVAARERHLPVVMLRRPPPPPGPSVQNLAGALSWLGAHLAGDAQGIEEKPV